MDFLTFCSIKSAIREYVRTIVISVRDDKFLNVHKYFSILNSQPKGSKVFYDALIENNVRPKSVQAGMENSRSKMTGNQYFLCKQVIRY